MLWRGITPCIRVCLFANVRKKGVVEISNVYVAGRQGKGPILRLDSGVYKYNFVKVERVQVNNKHKGGNSCTTKAMD